MSSDMIPVETAIRRVLEHTSPLSLVSLPLTTKLLGSQLAEDIIAHADFPPFRASIMDGYAVVAPLEPGVYTIQESIFAGSSPADNLNISNVAYITTGAMVPEGANSVIRVEDTELVNDGTNSVRIKVPVKVGANIRAIGSDIANGEVVLNKGTYIGPTELGLLATVGVSSVLCFRKPKIGVLSTGNELVDSHETPSGSQIRDSNRLSLISSFLEEGHDVVDLGIVSDSKEVLREKLLQASTECDVVVTSGGVSMGNADFVRPLLNELGTIHFCKLNMKPGKPTTFASYCSADGARRTLFFGLPGNPVSCLVTKALFVDPALKRLQGLASQECLHPQLLVKLEGGDITLDPERAEYHRAILRVDSAKGVVYASSTGNQRSSRLLSMRSSNALLFLPRGPGVVASGSNVTALVIRPLGPPPVNCSVHPSAASLDCPAALKPAESAKGSTVDKSEPWRTIRTGLLTISDRASQGVYKDESGPEMAKLLTAMSDAPDWPLIISITTTAVVPDDPAVIRQTIEHWSDPSNPQKVDFILTSGGTGFGIRDNTPEVIRPLLHREAPGIAQALLNEGLKFTPLAVMSRPVVGTRYTSFIATLPGSVKAVRENITCLKALLPRVFELLKCDQCGHP